MGLGRCHGERIAGLPLSFPSVAFPKDQYSSSAALGCLEAQREMKRIPELPVSSFTCLPLSVCLYSVKVGLCACVSVLSCACDCAPAIALPRHGCAQAV